MNYLNLSQKRFVEKASCLEHKNLNRESGFNSEPKKGWK
jgi:hypothetical protein